MAQIVVKTNDGTQVRVISASEHNLRGCDHSVLSCGALIHEVLKALDEALDIDVEKLSENGKTT